MALTIWMKSLFGLVMINTVLFKGYQCQEFIGPNPTEAGLIGHTHAITCSKAPFILNELAWFDDTNGENVQLYLGRTKLSFDAKYNNFGVVSGTAEQLDLQIADIALEDEGTYICQLVGTATQQQVIFTTEVRSSSLYMTQDGNHISLVTAREGSSLELKCTAVGARPAVTIDWYQINIGSFETRITNGVSQADKPNGHTFDSVSTFVYIATKDYNGGSLRCETTGQEVAESRQDTTSLDVQCATHPATTTTSLKDGGPNIGVIVASVIGGICGVCLIIFLIYFLKYLN